MFPVDKKKEKELRYIANKLQPTFYDANVKSFVKGSVLIDRGISEVDGKPVDAEKIYQAITPRPFMVNHRRRILNAYKNGGNDAVVEYLKAYNYIMRPHPINMGSQL